MPIEEKPQLLEFNCIIDGMEEVSWNIKYDPNDKVGLHISGNGQTFHCPVELFGDVTAFLQSKNIIQPDVRVKSLAVPMPLSPKSTINNSPSSFRALVPPQIDGQALLHSPTEEQPYSGPPMDALASFDIGTVPVRKESELEKEQPGIKIGETKVKSKDEVISRPVIRTRVSDNDPMSAEKEAAMLRGQGAAGSKKTIKKKHQIVD